MTWLRRLLTVVSLLAGALIAAFFLLGPQWVDRNANQVLGDPGRSPTAETRALHAQLIVGDLHADSALWGCLLYTSPSPRDATLSRMPSSA